MNKSFIFGGLAIIIILFAFSISGNSVNPLGVSREGGEGVTNAVNIASGATGTVLAAGGSFNYRKVCNDSTGSVILSCSYGSNATSGQGIILHASSTSNRCEVVGSDWVGGFTCYANCAATATVGGH